MTSLSRINKLVLKLIAQDGDYEYLPPLLAELKDYLPGTEDELLAIARSAARELLELGLVTLYRCADPGSDHEPLLCDQARSAVDVTLNWKPSETEPFRLGLAATPAGEEAYRRAFDHDAPWLTLRARAVLTAAAGDEHGSPLPRVLETFRARFREGDALPEAQEGLRELLYRDLVALRRTGSPDEPPLPKQDALALADERAPWRPGAASAPSWTLEATPAGRKIFDQ